VVTKQVKNILISLSLHLLLLLFLNDIKVQKPLSKPDVVQPIKSFLYIPKTAPLVPKLMQNDKRVTQEVAKESINNPINTAIDTTKTTSAKKTAKTESTKVERVKKQSITENNFTRGQVSANQLLDNLRKQLNKKMIEKNINEINRHRSLSAMHDQPISVPHSAPVYNDIEEKEKNTTHYSDGLKITKNSNGTCTVETDLSNVGIKGATSIEYFFCGESKMETNFRLHMKKVREKLR